jgi:hypothetical protein
MNSSRTPTDGTGCVAGRVAASLASMIHVEKTRDGDPVELMVVVRGGGSESRHRVRAARADLERLAPGQPPERCVEAAFRFLLDREPKESILGEFELTVIARYFPEFERELPEYLGRLPPI